MEFSQEAVTTLVVHWGTSLVLALATLIAGLFVAGVIGRLLRKVLDRAQVDPSLRSFLTSLTSILFKVMVYITALGVLGIEMTSFVAILAAAGLAVGMALSGTLQNFAGGVMILLFKPFKVGDFIEAQGYAGVVKEIQIFITVMTTGDNKTVLIPNGGLANGSLINYMMDNNNYLLDLFKANDLNTTHFPVDTKNFMFEEVQQVASSNSSYSQSAPYSIETDQNYILAYILTIRKDTVTGYMPKSRGLNLSDAVTVSVKDFQGKFSERNFKANEVKKLILSNGEEFATVTFKVSTDNGGMSMSGATKKFVKEMFVGNKIGVYQYFKIGRASCRERV